MKLKVYYGEEDGNFVEWTGMEEGTFLVKTKNYIILSISYLDKGNLRKFKIHLDIKDKGEFNCIEHNGQLTIEQSIIVKDKEKRLRLHCAILKNELSLYPDNPFEIEDIVPYYDFQ